jgi:hypothetical protein
MVNASIKQRSAGKVLKSPKLALPGLTYHETESLIRVFLETGLAVHRVRPGKSKLFRPIIFTHHLTGAGFKTVILNRIFVIVALYENKRLA